MTRVVPLALALVLAQSGCAKTPPPTPSSPPAEAARPRAPDPAPPPPPADAPLTPVASASVAPAPIAATGACASADGERVAKSPDGKIEVFVHTDKSRHVETTLGTADYEELCVRRDGAKATVLVAGRGDDATPPEKILSGFDNFVFSPDSKTLFFTTTAWVTSSAAHAVDLETKEERFLVDGGITAVLESGPYKGHLLATHFRLDPVHSVDSPKYRGRMETWSVVSRDGKTVRELPEGEAARKRVLGVK